MELAKPQSKHKRKLTQEQIAEIKTSSVRVVLLAKLFNVSPARISQIRNNSK